MKTICWRRKCKLFKLLHYPMDSAGWIPRKVSDSEGKQERKLSDSEGKQGRKQLLKHFIPVLVHDYSKQQWRNSSGHCCILRLWQSWIVRPRQTLSRQEDAIPACLPTVNFNMQPTAKPAWAGKSSLVIQTVEQQEKRKKWHVLHKA